MGNFCQSCKPTRLGKAGTARNTVEFADLVEEEDETPRPRTNSPSNTQMQLTLYVKAYYSRSKLLITLLFFFFFSCLEALLTGKIPFYSYLG